MPNLARVAASSINWSGCLIVRCEAGKIGGAPNINGYHITPETVLGNYQSGLSVPEIAEQFPPLTELDVKTIIDYAEQRGLFV